MQLIVQTLVFEETLDYEGSSLLSHEYYIDFLMEYGLFQRDELPPSALELYDLSHYEREVINGGHAQYLGNRDRWKQVPGAIADSCLAGLRAVPDVEYRNIYIHLCARLSDNRERAASIASTHGFSDLGTGYQDPVIGQLDRRFFAINPNYELGHFNVSRLKRLENLHPVSSRSFVDELASQIASNPYRASRRAAKGLGKYVWINDIEPEAVELLCERAGCRFVQGLMGGWHVDIEDQLTYGYVIETREGQCFVCFRVARDKPRPLYAYRDDPLYLYSFPDRVLLSTYAR